MVFDFGGVLIDWNPRHLYRKLFRDDASMEQFFAEVGFMEWNLEQDRGRPFAPAVDELSRRFPHHAAAIHAYNERWVESLAGPIQEGVDLLWELKQAGYPLYGLSNWSAEKFRLVKDQFPFLGWLDDYLISGEVKLVKPDPQFFHLFLKKVNRAAGECLLIDDSLANIEMAASLGFQTIHCISINQVRAELVQRGFLGLS